MDQILSFYDKLLFAPPEPSSVWYYVFASLFLLVPAMLIAWAVAFVYVQFVSGLRDDVTAHDRIKIAWSWGWAVVAFLLFLQLAQLALRDHMPSLWAGLPFYLIAAFGLLVAYLKRRSIRHELHAMQRNVQTR